MSHVDDLTAELCPDGVEFKPLGDISDLVRGNGMPKTDLTLEGVGAVHYGQIYTHYRTWAKQTISRVHQKTAERLAKVNPGDIIITNTSENLDDVGKAVAWLGDQPIVTGGHATVIRHHQDPKFLSYWFQTEKFAAQKRALATGTKVIDVSARQLAKVRVPVPPLELQREIVRILDTFTELEAELQAELEGRIKEQRALANNLFSRIDPATDGSRLVRLGDIATQHIELVEVHPDEEYTNLGVKWYGEGVFAREPKKGGAIRGTTLRRVQGNQFIYNRMFVVEGSFALVPPALSGGVVSSEFPAFDLDKDKVLPEWLVWYFQDEYTLKRVSREVTGVERGSTKSRRRWKEEQFAAFEILLPRLDAQEKIVEVLGGMQDLKASLSAELAARRKQYEYYRDKLLTFKEIEA